MNQNQITRRGFFVKLAQFTGVAIVAPSVLTSVLGSVAKAAGLPFVKESQDNAKAVHYVEDKKSIKDASMKKEVAGVTWDKQFCDNCGFFDSKTGGCTIFPGQQVKAKGWCMTWNKKA